MSYALWDTVIHVVCIVGYSYTCSIIVGIQLCSMYCGIQLYISYVL